MVTGKVLRFDEFKGYGFVSPSTGGDDVFIHVNDLEFDKRLLRPGAFVEFEVEDGDRGPKASCVRLTSGGEATPSSSAAPVSSSGQSERPDDGLVDVLSTKEFLAEVTEALLEAAPTATGEEIRNIRERLLRIGHSRGWVDA
ncbi:DNA-binding protein [Saccharomonospora piscinae]|uniref:DNA-binding protein n=1 Tax=Saccharomonospora piscinae TaxID=687388 RepID=A0A1V8ZXM9_SACPI|nr:cold shock domain-containing protein [Saccharomonospora piscinae]OQO89665.1 DNA-binding protein [Saccharomonospora piscinae]TLW91343.1 cold shock domain-containing protein [Saccharomonospora piscinae]